MFMLVWRLQRASNLVGAFHIVFQLFLDSKAFRLLLFGANDERMISYIGQRVIWCIFLKNLYFIEVGDFYFVFQVG